MQRVVGCDGLYRVGCDKSQDRRSDVDGFGSSLGTNQLENEARQGKTRQDKTAEGKGPVEIYPYPDRTQKSSDTGIHTCTHQRGNPPARRPDNGQQKPGAGPPRHRGRRMPHRTVPYRSGMRAVNGPRRRSRSAYPHLSHAIGT